MILFVNKEIISLIKKYNSYNIFLILMLVLSMIFSNFLLTYVCNSYINFGLVESISMSIYLPSVALISYFYYKKKLSYKQFIGILFIGLGAVLLS